LSATVFWFAHAAPAAADLVGTQVSGSFKITGFNIFDPFFGFVPSGTYQHLRPSSVLPPVNSLGRSAAAGEKMGVEARSDGFDRLSL
jgi:hypothetical protein